MKIETNSLVTVKHYADSKGVTSTTIYAWISKDKVSCVEIDGVKFIKVCGNEQE